MGDRASDCISFPVRRGSCEAQPICRSIIMAISSIHLLHEMMGDELQDWRHFAILTFVHLVLLATAAALAMLRRDRP